MKETKLPNYLTNPNPLNDGTIEQAMTAMRNQAEMRIQEERSKNIIVRMNDDELNPSEISGMAKLYADVFRGPPWNEAVKCSIDGQFRDESTPLGSPCECGGTFVEAYPLKETKEYIEAELRKPGARSSLLISTINKEIVGFAWSYITTAQKLIEDKWSNPINKQEIMELLINNGLSPDQPFQYLSEAGIKASYRGFGFSNILVTPICGPEFNLARTNISTAIMTVASNIGFQQIMGPEVILDRSNKIAIPTGRVINRLDTERDDRVLLIKKPLWITK